MEECNMNELKVYEHEDFGEVRTADIDGEPWFCGKDVARALGYAKPLNAVATHVDEDDVLYKGLIDSIGREQQTKLINESGIYALVFGSELPTAKKFKRWITKEVIPSIVKTGSYNLPSLTTNELILQMAQNAVELERQLGEVKSEVRELGGRVENAVKIFATPTNDWVSAMNLKISELTGSYGGSMSLKGKLFRELECVTGACLSNRKSRLKTRMKKQGHTYRARQAITKLDVVAQDKSLKNIFENILSRYQAQSALIGGAEQ